MVESFKAVKSSRSRTYVSNDEIDRRALVILARLDADNRAHLA